MNDQQNRLIRVLENIIKMAKNDEDDTEMFSDEIEAMLTRMALNDAFGTEQQCDPRGDFRDGEQWSMWRVEGVYE